MPDNRTQETTGGSSIGGERRPVISDRLEQFEKRQGELWRLTFFLLFVLSIVFAVISWDTIRSLAHRFEALPVGLVILVALFGFYAWKRTQEISELRGLVRGIEQRDTAPPSGKQMDQLFAVIERSQQGYRDLIDSFDDLLLVDDPGRRASRRQSPIRRSGRPAVSADHRPAGHRFSGGSHRSRAADCRRGDASLPGAPPLDWRHPGPAEEPNRSTTSIALPTRCSATTRSTA